MPKASAAVREGYSWRRLVQLLVLVSCARWSDPVDEVDYTLTIDKQ